MSKKYFTKYLPVEGEVKADELFKLRDSTYYCLGTDGGLIWYDNGLNGSPGDAISADPVDCTKLKLFLCSRDVQVGDTVTTTDRTELVETESSAKYLSNHPSWFKVIGEVSPEAVWITEGMEFDEEDVSLQEMWYCNLSQAWQPSNGAGFFFDSAKGPIKAAMFRCPSSPNHFH